MLKNHNATDIFILTYIFSEFNAAVFETSSLTGANVGKDDFVIHRDIRWCLIRYIT